MVIRIFTIYHGDNSPHPPRGPYVPLSVHETRGDDIAGRETYGEMRAHYLVWKHLLGGLDYVGFQHYRRWLCLPALIDSSLLLSEPYVDDKKAFEALVSANLPLPNAIEGLDAVVAEPWIFPRPIGEEYAGSHIGAHWEAMLEEWPEARLLAMGEHTYNVCNIFIMRVALFRAYMEFWWHLARRIEARIDIPADPYQGRAMAFLSERIFSLWLKQRRAGLMVVEVPLVMDTSRAS